VRDLWYYEGPPDSEQMIQRIFDAVPHPVIFAGHYHRWLLVTPKGVDSWAGTRQLDLCDGRFFVVVGALCEGRFAVFDTNTRRLSPLDVCGAAHDRRASFVRP